MKNVVKGYIESGLVVLPVDAAKRPIRNAWQTLTNAECRTAGYLDYWNSPDMKVGLLCGGENNCEALDFDTKNSLDPELFSKYTARILEAQPDLMSKLTVQKTVSGGYHLIYKCAKIDRNLKLARRPATHQEMIDTNAKCYVEIETRGANGMVVIAPSAGYKLLRNTFENIQEITVDERDLLLTVARSFNTFEQPHTKPIKFQAPIQGSTIWEEFNQDTYGGIALLEQHGWTRVKEKGEDILLKRPGNSTAAFSAYYHTRSNIFVPFTSSSEFDPEKGYNNASVLHILEGHNGDWKRTADRLKEMGYGKVEYNANRAEKARHDEENGVKIEETEEGSNVADYIEDSSGYIDYLEKSRTGKLELGLTTGSRYLDDYFLFKRGNFVVTLAFPSAGKSFFWWFLSCVTNRHHKWRWLVFSSENKTGQVIKKLIEFQAEKRIVDLSAEELAYWRGYIDSNYRFININQSYVAKDILRIAEEYLQYWKFDGLLIDPYNSLIVGNQKNAHQYHYEVVTLMRSFCSRTGVYLNLNIHPNTGAGRNKDGDGKSKVPHPSDAEGGIMFLNRADEFLILDRMADDPHLFRQTNIHVRKIKDMESGGKPTPYELPVTLTLMDGVSFVDQNQVRIMSGRLYHEPKDYSEPTVKPNTGFDAPKPLSDDEISF